MIIDDMIACDFDWRSISIGNVIEIIDDNTSSDFQRTCNYPIVSESLECHGSLQYYQAFLVHVVVKKAIVHTHLLFSLKMIRRKGKEKENVKQKSKNENSKRKI